MASDETSKSGVSDYKTNYNPKLDFFSEQFDPLLALRTPDVVVPVANAKIYDNISKFESVMQGKATGPKTKSKETAKETPIERRWLPHQLPVASTKRPNGRNVFTRMEKMEGPLKLLNTCKDNRHRIKVWTRHSHDIRGYCTAILVAFDKHWNLALEDVDEVWTRKKRRKVPAIDGAKVDPKIKSKVLPPQITIIESSKKTETCSRHVGQLLLRGEHVAYIVVIGQLEGVEQK